MIFVDLLRSEDMFSDSAKEIFAKGWLAGRMEEFGRVENSASGDAGVEWWVVKALVFTSHFRTVDDEGAKSPF